MIARLPCFGGCLPLFLLLAGVSLCQGRIGDTLEEEVARYGKPVNQATSEDYAMFKQAPYYITVHFHDQKTDAITYVKAASGTQNAFSNDEIDRLLRINAGGRDWQQSNNSAGRPRWKTGDEKLQAVYSESKFLVITTDEYLTRLQAAEKEAKQKEKAAAEGTEQKSASANRKKGQSGKKNPSPKKALSLQKSAAPAKKKAAASTKGSTTTSPKRSTAASAKKGTGASTKKNAAASRRESATSSVKKNTTTSTKKSAGPSNKKGSTTSTKKGAAPTKKSPAPSEEHGD